MPKIKLYSFSKRQILLIAVFIFFLFNTIKEIPSISFEYDESQWIHTSTYYEVLLTQPAQSHYWQENYWTITQPPMARYIIGFSRSLFGFESAELNTPWDFDASYEENEAKSRVPSDRLLYASRFPMAILMSLTATILFALFLESTGLPGAGIFLWFFVSSDFLKSNFVRAMGEAPFFFFITLAAFFTLLAVKVLKKMEPAEDQKHLYKYYLLLFAAGASCGLAGASKINGLISCAAIGFLILLQGLFFSKGMTRDQKMKLVIHSSFIILFSTLFAFVMVNPYLYASPLVRLARMYKYRLEVMELQIVSYPQYHISSIGQRIPLLFKKVFADAMPLRFFASAWVYLLLGISGGIAIIKGYWKWLKNGSGSPDLMVIAALVLPLALAGYMTPLSWGRYLVPCVFLNDICVPVGIYAGILALSRALMTVFPMRPKEVPSV
jgi:hypothetical protein